MPVCPNCGNSAADSALFCDQCGTKLAAPEASAPVEAAVETTAGGVPQDIVICPACGAENVPGEVFCDACGEPLESPEPVAAEVVVEESPAAEPAVEAEPIEEPTVEMEVVEEVEEAEEVVEEAKSEDESYCPVCGASVHPDDTFCGSCGASLSADTGESWEEEPEEELVEEPEPEVIAPEEVAPEELVVEELVEEELVEEELLAEQVVPEEPVLESEPADVEETVVEDVVIEETVVEETVVEEPAEPVCPVCGAKVLADQVFCASCGAKLLTAPVVPELVAETPSIAPEIAVPTGPYLAVVASGAHIPLVEQPESLVGRTDDVSGIYPDVDMTPHGGEEGGVSRRHARLIFEGGKWFVEDLDSTNGTYVNETELAPKTRTALSDGDAVGFGDVEMTFHLG